MPRKLLNANQIKPRYQRPDLQKRREVLRDTVQKLGQNHAYYFDNASKNHRLWQASNNRELLKQAALNEEVTKRVRVVEGDWGEVTQALSKSNGQIYAVLNMANAYTPGGGYLEGMAAQEENMFRRTDCHFYVSDNEMDRRKDRYTAEMTTLINGEGGRVFLDTDTPRVCIKGRETPNVTGYEDLGEDNYFLFYELKAAADDLRGGYPFSEDNARRKIRAQLDTLKSKGVRHVVLSAFGCGAFLNPPEQIARIYKEELEQRPDDFDDVTFAVYYPGYGSNNFPSFYRALDGLALTSELRETDRLHLENYLGKLKTELNSSHWDQRGYRFPFFDFRKTPQGIEELREVLSSEDEPFAKFHRLQEIAQERLANPPKYTQRDGAVHKLYTEIMELKIEQISNFNNIEVDNSMGI